MVSSRNGFAKSRPAVAHCQIAPSASRGFSGSVPDVRMTRRPRRERSSAEAIERLTAGPSARRL